MSTNRETIRDALVTQFTIPLVGAGLPVKTVTGSKVKTLVGLTPLVAILSAGTLRERMTFTGDQPTFYFTLQTWVSQETTGWTNAQAEDALDQIESLIAGVLETAVDDWEMLQLEGPTEVVEVSVAGQPYYLERGRLVVKLARN